MDYKPGANPSKKADNPGHGNPGHGNPGHGNPGHGNPGHGNPGHGNPGHGNPEADAIAAKIKDQGDKVRNLKSKKAPKVSQC